MDTVKDYAQDVESIKQFLKEYSYVDSEDQVVPKYVPALTRIADREAIVLTVELSDLEQFNHVLADQVVKNTVRYTKLFYEALDDLLPQFKTRDPAQKDIMDVFIEQRLFISERNSRNNQNTTNAQSLNVGAGMQRIDPTGNKNVDIDGKYPPDLIRRSEVYFKPATLQAIPIREVDAECVGKLVTIRGIVTRATDVKPRITVATYTCDQCGCETFQEIAGVDYTPLFECTSSACKASKNVGRLTPQMRGSKFVKYQEIKLQEHSDQCPTGNIPRTVTVVALGEQTRRCAPGDHISVSGIFDIVKRTGFRPRNNAGQAADTSITAHYITEMNKTENDEINNDPLTEEEAEQLIGQDRNFITRLSKSIAPEIFGHEKLKTALLLLLVGGVDKTSVGLKIRGNINICVMGDPGVAKSQLLIFIDRLASRSQYTSGRGSSGVGLTAAVLKDPITNELVLEGGALVLADQGICCIDEFDKMVDSDRTAIHEVMEQQTVSIAKAGIMTTLNARVSILAAANPAYGRYNIKRSVTDNLQLPPALLSRFDLLWLIRDESNKTKDLDLAQHVLFIHSNPTMVASVEQDVIDMQTMRRYIKLCQTKRPTVPERLSKRLVEIYLGIREKRRQRNGDDSMFTSPRSLLAIIRLSTAFARLRLANEVDDQDIEDAIDIYNASRQSIDADIILEDSPESRIMRVIEQLARDSKSVTLTLESLKSELEQNSISTSQIETHLSKLEKFDYISYDKCAEEITLIEELQELN